jgi:Ser/Thr protein kinase RdoA (MazF antagonist)
MDLPPEIIEKLFGKNLSFIEKIAGGFLSENYALTDGNKKFFLKKHRHTNQNQVAEVCLVEQFFAEGGVPVILPIPTEQGESFFEHAGSFYSLYPFVEGRQIARGKLTEAATVSLGHTLGALHKHGKDSTLQITTRFKAVDTDNFLSKVAAIEAEIVKEKPLSDFGAMVLDCLRLKKQAVLENTVTYDQLNLPNNHLIHGDYFCDNVFFDQNDYVSYVFDFEKTQYAPPLFELFRSLFVSFLTVPTEENILFAKKYLDAYLEAYPFPKEIVRNSLTLTHLRQVYSLWIEEEHYLKHNTRPDSLLPTQHAFNKYYLNNRKAVDEYLLG